MPNPKTGTVTMDVGKAVSEFKSGRVEYRTDKVGNIHVPVGKVSFTKAQLVANVHAVVEELVRVKPAAAKGRYLQVGHPVLDDGPGDPHRSDPGPTRSTRSWPPSDDSSRSPRDDYRCTGPSGRTDHTHQRRRPPVHLGAEGARSSPPDEAIRSGTGHPAP